MNCMLKIIYADENKFLKSVNKLRDIPCLYVGRLNIVEMSNFPIFIYTFMQFVTLPECFYRKFIWKIIVFKIGKTILNKRKIYAKQSLDIKTYYIAMIIKTLWYDERIDEQIN